MGMFGIDETAANLWARLRGDGGTLQGIWDASPVLKRPQRMAIADRLNCSISAHPELVAQKISSRQPAAGGP